MELKYGKHSINFEISNKNRLGVLELEDKPTQPLDRLLKSSIMHPIGKPSLGALLTKNKPGDLVIIVSDITRSIANYSEILKFLVGEIVDAGIDEKNIEFVVASGTHRPHTPEENERLYQNLIHNFHFSFHDCQNNMVSLGRTSSGLEVQVNKRAYEADFIMVTGKINFHYLAGFSGGRKSILPGIASYQTIRNNHCKLKRDGVAVGKIKNNIIAQEMTEAGQLFDIDYLLNVVETSKKETAQIFCGHSEFAFGEGVKFFDSLHTIKITKLADCAIIAAGGYPKDTDFFHSHKGLNMAINALKPNGSIILVAQCCEGFGSDKFSRYLLENSLNKLLNYPEKKIELGGHRAFVTAKILKEHKVYVLSNLDPNILSRMGFVPVSNMTEAINLVKKEHGVEFSFYIIPEGSSVLPTSNL